MLGNCIDRMSKMSKQRVVQISTEASKSTSFNLAFYALRPVPNFLYGMDYA